MHERTEHKYNLQNGEEMIKINENIFKSVVHGNVDKNQKMLTEEINGVKWPSLKIKDARNSKEDFVFFSSPRERTEDEMKIVKINQQNHDFYNGKKNIIEILFGKSKRCKKNHAFLFYNGTQCSTLCNSKIKGSIIFKVNLEKDLLCQKCLLNIKQLTRNGILK